MEKKLIHPKKVNEIINNSSKKVNEKINNLSKKNK